MQKNMRGWRVKDINPTWNRYNQTGRVVRIIGEKVYWVSDTDGEVVIDKISDLEMTQKEGYFISDIKRRWKI